MSDRLRRLALGSLAALIAACPPASAGFLDEVGSVGEEQIKEKEELRKMQSEIDDIKGTVGGAMQQLRELNDQAQQSENLKEVHLFAREGTWQIREGENISCLTYNSKIPGPVIHAVQGDPVKIVLHNQMKTSTSLYFHGLSAPHGVNGLPRTGQGLVEPGQTFVYQFVAGDPGTYWYHPHIVHADQRLRGLFGVLIVSPRLKSRGADLDLPLVFSRMQVKKEAVKPAKGAASTVLKAVAGSGESHYLINGKEAPMIPPLELRRGARVKLRLINAGDEAVPLHLSGHKLELSSISGGDRLEPHVFRDTFTLQPSDSVDAEFQANNPGVWSLASELFHQASRDGRFPGGMAMIVRYSESRVK